MKLFKYPVLVFDNIIKQLDPIPLVSLSFCSRKTRERIKRVSFGIKDAWFGNVVQGDEGYFLEVIFPKTSNSLLVDSGFLSRNDKNKSKNFSIQIRDTPYICRYLKEEHSIYLGTIEYKKVSKFFNYFLDLVRTVITYVTLVLKRLDDVEKFISKRCFQNVQYIYLEGKNVPVKKVIELYDCLEKPVLETYVESKIRALRPTSKLLRSENLSLNSSKFISIEHLLNFTGKYIYLNSSSISEDGIVTFIKHWLNGNYPNLEGAVITTLTELEYETERVLQEFNKKRWNPAERAQNFILKASFRQLAKDARKHFNNFKVRIGDTAYNIGCLKEKEEPDRDDIYLGLTRYKQASIFFNYILDLVRTKVTIIYINLNRFFDIKHFRFEPCFKNIQCIKLVGKSTPAKKVIELYDCFEKPILQTITKSYITSFSPTSKLLQSENLSLNPSRFISIEHLLNFNGKYITMYFTTLSEEDIVRFVKHWLNGNYPNLEGAVIICPMRLQYETEKVLQGRYSRDEKGGFPIIDRSNGHDMVRNDGLMATMQFDDDDSAFTFFVWHNRKIEEHEPYRSDFYLGCIGYKKTYVFFNYILDLVRTGITDIWINLNKLVNIKQFLSEPVFKNVQKIMLLGKSVDSKKVNELYDCFEKPMLETRVKPHIESLSPTSKLLQSENLEFKPSKSISIEHLLNFNGKYIDLERSLLQEEDIVAFIKHWLDGNYPNLEGAYITCQGNSEYETEKVLDEFNTKQWNPAERAQNFILKASYYRDEKDGFPKVDCANGYDLERSDGLLATILFGEHDDAFNFFVWHNRFP
ncbi:unnamed protein product [Caenorhabditis brenneri]